GRPARKPRESEWWTSGPAPPDERRTIVGRGRKPMIAPRLALGDVFVVPVGDGRAAVGQIVGTYGSDAYYFAIFDGVVSVDEVQDRLHDVLTGPVLLLALSMDAKFYAGHWTVVARAPVADIPLPAYK